jgi:hypothetical protein
MSGQCVCVCVRVCVSVHESIRKRNVTYLCHHYRHCVADDSHAGDHSADGEEEHVCVCVRETERDRETEE